MKKPTKKPAPPQKWRDAQIAWKIADQAEKLRAELLEKARQSMPKLEEPVMRAAIHEMQLLEKRKRELEDDIAVIKRFILRHSPTADEAAWKGHEP